MNVLIACEFSGIVREAFASLGHNAWSCDLEDTEIQGNHYKGDVRDIIKNGWHLMIAHPPCTYLCSSGIHWEKKQPHRKLLKMQALRFVRDLLEAPIEHICLENPIGQISTYIRKPDQIIQPYMFGHPESKATCLWLKNLPKLTPTNLLVKQGKYWNNQTPSGQNKLGPSPTRARDRARTYQGIAEAMAIQFSTFIKKGGP